jgi:hypothetical protein
MILQFALPADWKHGMGRAGGTLGHFHALCLIHTLFSLELLSSFLKSATNAAHGIFFSLKTNFEACRRGKQQDHSQILRESACGTN